MSLLSDAVNSLFGTGKQTTTNAQTPTVPPDVEAARKDLLERARAYANEPFPLYNQPRVAGFTPDQLAGFGATRGLAGESAALGGMTSGLVQEGVTAARDLAQRLPDVNIQEYMSPYMQGVLDPTIRDIEERAARQRLALGQQAARTGSFGGSRQAISEAELERATQRNISEESARQRAQAYNQALQQFREDQTRIPQLYSTAIGQVGTGLGQVANRFGSEVNPLLQIGGMEQGLNQRNLDVLRENFLEERDYPLRGIDVLRGSLGLGSSNLGIGTSQSQTTPGANPLSTIIGGATQIPGLISNVKTGLDYLKGWL